MANKERKIGGRAFRCAEAHSEGREVASNSQMSISSIIMHQIHNIASNLKLMHNETMRTTITLDDETHEFAAYYARARGISLSAAIDELIRKAQAPAASKPDIRYSPDGFPMFPPTGRVHTPAMVKEAESELE
jgi:hypothetical protein